MIVLAATDKRNLSYCKIDFFELIFLLAWRRRFQCGETKLPPTAL